jgi:uncharacterized protein YggU (UPF0235/DUF167 family)
VLHVWLTAAPVDGAANQELIKFLAEHYGVARSSIRLVSGLTGRRKLVEISRLEP